jgi:CMP/dCMP kinase
MGRDPVIIAIDGPSGAGKSTVSRALARQLGFYYIDSGALYRIVALELIAKNIGETNEGEIARICDNLKVDFLNENGEDGILHQGVNIAPAIRAPEVGMCASRISALRVIRDHLTALQRKLGRRGNSVVEGRDAGTVVFPHAPVKFYLDASPAERGKRRYEELRNKGFEVTLKLVTEEVLKRDYNDSTRIHAPLLQAPDAVLIDSTGLEVEAVVGKMMHVITSKLTGGTI